MPLISLQISHNKREPTVEPRGHHLGPEKVFAYVCDVKNVVFVCGWTMTKCPLRRVVCWWKFNCLSVFFVCVWPGSHTKKACAPFRCPKAAFNKFLEKLFH